MLEEQTLRFKLMRTINPAAKNQRSRRSFKQLPSAVKQHHGWAGEGGMAFRHSPGGFGKRKIPACPWLGAVRALGAPQAPGGTMLSQAVPWGQPLVVAGLGGRTALSLQ